MSYWLNTTIDFEEYGGFLTVPIEVIFICNTALSLLIYKEMRNFFDKIFESFLF